MHFKKSIIKRVYILYLRGIDIERISYEVEILPSEVDYIIDFINEVYV